MQNLQECSLSTCFDKHTDKEAGSIGYDSLQHGTISRAYLTNVEAGGIVQHISVQLPCGDEHDCDIAEGLPVQDGEHDEEACGALDESGDGLHLDCECVTSCVAGVCLGILLPCDTQTKTMFADAITDVKHTKLQSNSNKLLKFPTPLILPEDWVFE